MSQQRRTGVAHRFRCEVHGVFTVWMPTHLACPVRAYCKDCVREAAARLTTMGKAAQSVGVSIATFDCACSQKWVPPRL
jgi:hypothetical protein